MIITRVSKSIDTSSDLQFKRNDLCIVFSDYRRFNYSYTSERGVVGFLFFKEAVCNNIDDSTCIRINNDDGIILLGSDKSSYTGYISSDDNIICAKTNYQNLFFKIIEDPINGWHLFEKAFFRRIAYVDKNLLDAKEVFELYFPVYVFLNKKLKAVFITKVLVDFSKGVSIKSLETKKVY